MLTKKIILLLAVALMLTDLSTQFTPTILSPLPKRRKFKTSEEAMEFLLSLFKTTPKPKQRSGRFAELDDFAAKRDFPDYYDDNSDEYGFWRK